MSMLVFVFWACFSFTLLINWWMLKKRKRRKRRRRSNGNKQRRKCVVRPGGSATNDLTPGMTIRPEKVMQGGGGGYLS